MKLLKKLFVAAFALATVSLSAQSGSLPTPASVFGFEPGTDYKLATYTQSVEYFKKLAAASPSMKLFEAGKSSQGRTYVYAAISTPANLANLDKYRQIAQRLAAGLGDRLRLNASVLSVEQARDEVIVRWAEDGRERELRARHAIVATQAHVTRRIVRGLPEETAAALDLVRYGPYVVGAFLTNETQGNLDRA